MITANLGYSFVPDRAFSGRSNQLGPEFGSGLIWVIGNNNFPNRNPPTLLFEIRM
jgi:hypothetical protein